MGNKCCMADEFGRWCIGQELITHNDKKYCRFHSPKKEGTTFSNIHMGVKVLDKVANLESIKGAEINENIVFRDKHVKAIAETDILESCKFNGDITFLCEGKYEELDINLKGVTFCGSVRFNNFKEIRLNQLLTSHFDGNEENIVIFSEGTEITVGELADNICREINTSIDFQGVKIGDKDFQTILDLKFNGGCNFSGHKFARDIVFDNIDSENYLFQNVVFNGDAHFKNINFGKRSIFKNATFKKDVNFEDINHDYGKTDPDSKGFIEKANFKGNVKFKLKRTLDAGTLFSANYDGGPKDSVSFFDGNAIQVEDVDSIINSEVGTFFDFSNVKFFGPDSYAFGNASDFSHLNFKKGVDLSNKSFHTTYTLTESGDGRSYIYSNSVFEDRVFFNGVSFINSSTFEKVVFKKDVFFYDVKFNEKVSFSEVRFDEYGSFKARDDDKVMFVKGADFSDCRVSKNVKFEDVEINRVEFLGSNIGNINFVNCDWDGPKLEGRVYDESVIADTNDEYKFKKVENLYRQLKERNTREQHWGRVSNWHYREKEMSREASFHMASISRWFGLRLYKFLSGYNERPMQAIRVLIFMVFLLGLIVGGEDKGQAMMNGAEFLPFVDTVKDACCINEIMENRKRFGVILMQVLISIQIALVVMSVRNKLRR